MNKQEIAALKEKLRLATQRIILAANSPKAEEAIRKGLQMGASVELMPVRPGDKIAAM